MVSDPLGLPFAGPLAARGGGASGSGSAHQAVAPAEPWSLSPQALPAASTSALHGHRGDGAVLTLRGVTT